jgi:hypothetical protein
VWVVPGDVKGSKLIGLVERREKPNMPPKQPLTPDEVRDLSTWIAAGAAYDGTLIR